MGSRGLRRRAVLTVCVAVVLGAAASVFGVVTATSAQGTRADSGSLPVQDQGPAAIDKLGRELPNLRTESSDTYQRGNGTRVLRAFGRPVNYRDSTGAWQPIEDQLVQRAGAWQTKASGVPVTLPSKLGEGPVSIGSGSRIVSLDLEGASDAEAAVSGATSSYQAVLPGTSASYAASGTSVRETLTLANAEAPTVYRYALSLSAGLHPVLTEAGTVNIVDSSGHTVYWLAAPTVEDSSTANDGPLTTPVHYELSEDGKTLSLVVNDSWLHDPTRVFPVRIDPDIYWSGAEPDCTIRSGSSAGTSLCGQALVVGSNSATPREVSRTLFRVSVSSIPQDADILSSSIGVRFRHESSSTPVNIQAFALSREFTTSATWNTYDGVHSWSTAGGDYTSQTLPGGGTQPYGQREMLESYVGWWTGIAITPLVEKWVREPSTNHGVLLKAQNETTGFYDEFNQSGHAEEPEEAGEPDFEVVYTPVLGTPASSTLTNIPIDDSASMAVNVADGNLLISHQDVHLPGVGYDFSLADTYNSEATGEAQDEEWPEGGYQSVDSQELNGTTFSAGADVTMERYWVDESRIFHDPSGSWWTFIREPSLDSGGNKAFLSPSGLNATLLVNSSTGKSTLTYNTSLVKYEFAEAGDLEKIVDKNGNTTTFHYGSEGKTSSVVDTHGHTVNFAYEGTSEEEGNITKISDELGRHWKFSENSSRQVVGESDPDGHELKYEYNEQQNPKQITDPRGHLIELSYDEDERVSEIRRVINGTATTPGSKDVITTYKYSIPVSGSVSCPTGSYGDTEVVSPDGSPNGEADSKATGHKTFYCFNNQDQVTKTIDQAGNASTTSYNAATGTPSSYQNPGDTAGGLNVNNTIAYAANGAVEKIVDGTGESSSLTTNFNYTGSGTYSKVEPSSIKTPFSAGSQSGTSHSSFIGYDANGNVENVHQGSATGSPSVALVHNTLGQVTESTDGDGNKTKYEYNTKHDLIKITPPSPLGVTELTYDAIDRVKTVKDGRGITATYTYNGEDQVTKVEYSDGSSVSFEYDADGNTIKRTDAAGFGEPYTGVTSYEYDKLNRPILETTPTAKSTTYEYDYDGNLTSLKDTGGTVTYTYGPDDVLSTLTEPGNSAHPFKFGYETGDDNRESTLYPNGILQCSKTDPAGRLTSLRAFKPTSEQTCASSVSPSSTLEDYSLSYTFEGEEGGKKVNVDTPDLQTLTNLKAENATAYGYDNLDRLLGAVTKPTAGGAATLTSEYEYDHAGNILTNHTYSPSTTYSNNHNKYNAANEICAIATTAPSACATPSEPGIAGDPTYDTDGNMTSDGNPSGAAKFAYTARDQLSSITPHGGSSTSIVSHGTGQEDLAAIGTEEVIQNVLGVASNGTGESANYYTRSNEGTLLAKRKPGEKPSETQYYLADPFGSVAMLTSSTGTQTAPTSGTYQYDPYGSPIGTGPATFGYRSGQVLPDGLLHYGARYYDPANTNWTQQDPINQIGSVTQSDRFLFAGSDPINESDPSGEAVPSRATCAVMAFLAFCQMNGGTELQKQVNAVNTAESEYRSRGEVTPSVDDDEDDAGGDLLEDIVGELL
jgi:RHS repeat-associated protein